MSLLQDVLRSHTAEDKKFKSAAHNASDESDDDFVNVVSLPATPDHTRPSSPIRGASARPLRGPLHISSSRRDLLRAFPTEVSQKIFSFLSIRQLAKDERSPKSTSFSRGSGYSSPVSKSGYQTPRELKEEQWRLEAEAAAKPGKIEMREMYKELGGRKSKSKYKFGAPGTRDRGGWEETTEW
ncbi:hypothetical protein C0989_002423 [Termitomyces sp. Mn162]|nr:hypothetical protein C0989_002423 [Termitomyces sp. Mn162]